MRITYLIYGIMFFIISLQSVLGALNTSQLVYYKIDETSGVSVVDSLGIHNGIADSGATITTSGKINNARNFSMGKIDIGNIGALNDFTYNAWINPQNITSSQRIIATRKSDGSAEAQMEINPSTNSIVIGIQSSSSAWKAVKCNAGLSINTWTMVTVTRTGSSIKCYLNGVEVSTTLLSSSGSVGTINTGVSTYIGKNPTGANNYFGGRIDEVGIWSRVLNATEISELYNGGVGLQYPYDSSSAPVNSITFVSQSPSNLTATSLFSSGLLNVTFNFRNDSLPLTSSVLNVSFSGGLNCVQFVNGSCVFDIGDVRWVNSSANSLYISNSSDYSFYLGENDVYPYIALLNDSFFDFNHSSLLLGKGDFVKTAISGFNASLDTYSFLELMVNVSSGGLSRVYLCNDSYTSGSVTSSSFCQKIGEINSSGFNHSHGNSKHNIIAFNIINGKVNQGIGVSNTMFVLVTGVSGDVYSWYIPNQTRVDTTETSSNGGVLWSPQSYTMDLRIHNYPIDNPVFLRYNAFGLFNGSNNFSSSVSELIDFTPFPPSPPIISSPFGNVQDSRFLNITYSNASVNFPNLTISFYNISLLNEDMSFNRSIRSNNGLNLSFYWDVYSENLTLGVYYVKVTAVDSLNQTASDEQFFNLTKNALLTFNAGNGSVINNFSINLTNLNTSVSEFNSTINGQLNFNIVKGQFYNALIDAPGFAFSSVNLSYNQSFNNYTFGLVLSNSVNVSVLDEESNALILQNVTMVFTRRSDSLQYSYTFTGGTYFVYGLLPGVYDVTFTSTTPLSYGSRSYTLTINDRTTQSLTAILSQSTFNAGFYFKSVTDSVIVGASVTLSKLINSSYIVVGSDISDVTGYVTFNVRNGALYRFSITGSGFEPRTFDMRIYSVNSPYTFRLTPIYSTTFENLYDYVYYRTFPVESLLNFSTNYSFSLETHASNGSLIFQSINCSGNYSSSSGSPEGITSIVGLDTTGRSSVRCVYFFVFEPPFFNHSVNVSWVNNYVVMTNNNSVVDSARLIKNEVSNPMYLTILSYIIIFVVCFIVFGWSSGNPYIVSVTLIIGVVVFSYLGWINSVIGGLVAFIGAMLMFMQNRGF